MIPGPVKKHKIPKFVPCGKCEFCIDKIRRAWVFRLEQELKASLAGAFLTLTYADEHLPVYDDGKVYIQNQFLDFLEPTLNKEDAQLFMKRVRRSLSYLLSGEQLAYKKHPMYLEAVKRRQAYSKWPPVRYFLVGEYGGMFSRPHYHVLLFNYPKELHYKLNDLWGKGFVHIGTIQTGSIRYCTEYMLQMIGSNRKDRIKPFSMCSKGIGKNYVHKKENGLKCITNGNKYSLPRYYRDKIYDKWDNLYLSLEARKRADYIENQEISRLRQYRVKNPELAMIRNKEQKRIMLYNKQNKKAK